jgi:hypothetical protein
MNRWLDWGTAGFALIAAVFWFLSAFGKIPDMKSYWDQAPANDPFFVSLATSASYNRTAAFFSFLSASCAGLKLFSSRLVELGLKKGK